MRDSLIVFFPPPPKGLPIANGHILAFVGAQAVQEFEYTSSRDTDEYDLDPAEFPGAGIYVWEGEIVPSEGAFEVSTFNGKWRPAQVHDLQLAGLILGMTS